MNIFNIFRNRSSPLKVSILGTGSWGTTIGKILAENTVHNYLFDTDVMIWARSEQIKNEINQNNTNSKYLKNIKLPNNLICSNNLEKVYTESDIVVFAIPYPYILETTKQISNFNNKNKKLGILLTKGFHSKDGKHYPLSYYIKDMLNIEMTVLSGANVAKWIALEEYASATIGCLDIQVGNFIKELFITDYFSVQIVKNIKSVELFSCIKNVIALGAGIIDGLGYNANTKAEIIRVGCLEMIKLIKHIHPDIECCKNMFLENCGLADIITTCYGGRNRLCSEVFVKSGANLDQIEKDLLNGQKLQGPATLKSIHLFIKDNNLMDDYPLFNKLYQIFFENKDPNILLNKK